MRLRLTLAALASLLAFSACGINASDNRCTPPPAPEHKPLMPDLPRYFPASLASEGESNGNTCVARLDADAAEMFSSGLFDLHEPVISTGRADALRFVWLGSFGGFAVIRIETREGIPHLVAKFNTDRLSVKPTISVERNLTSEELAQLQRLLDNDPFSDSTEVRHFGIDGSSWLLERMEGGKYDLVERWSPEKARIRETGLYLAKLAGLTPRDLY